MYQGFIWTIRCGNPHINVYICVKRIFREAL